MAEAPLTKAEQQAKRDMIGLVKRFGRKKVLEHSPKDIFDRRPSVKFIRKLMRLASDGKLGNPSRVGGAPSE